MSHKKKLYSLDYHEALDRAYLINSMIEDYLLSLPAIKQEKKIRKKIGKAQKHLLDAYQMIGSIEY